MNAASGPPMTRPMLFCYALGSFGTGVFSTVPTVLLLYYCTDIVHIAPAWAAVIVFLPKVWGVVWDPLVGVWSDRTSTRFGRRRPFIAIGSIGVAAAFAGLFAPPRLLSVGAATLWIGLAYFALATLYSIFAVPYIAIPPEVGADAASRARLVRWRMFLSMIGVLAGAGLAPLLVAVQGGGPAGYAGMAVIIAAVSGLAMAAPLWMLRLFDPPKRRNLAPVRHAISAQIRIVLRSRRFVWLVLAYLAMLTGAGALSAAGPYLVVRILGRSEADIGLALGAMLVATTLSIPAVSALGQRFGERFVLSCALLLYAVLSAWLGWSAQAGTSWPRILLIFMALGAPFAASQVLPFTLLAHTIHDELANGSDAEGFFTGIWTAFEKVGLALGPALVGVSLAVESRVQIVIPLFIAVVPTTLILAALLPLFLSRGTGLPSSIRHAH